ncbi:MAG: MoaD/ThiS family protein [Candidatus Bathyarchaeota archaeon]
MKIKVQYLGPVRVVVNKREEDVEISSKPTIHNLLNRLSEMYGKPFERETFEEKGENLRDDFIVTVNGTAIRQLNGMKTLLKTGDVVALLPIFAGGG